MQDDIDPEESGVARRPRNLRGATVTQTPVEAVGPDPEVDRAPTPETDRPSGPAVRREWTDRDGRHFVVMVPEDAPPEHARMGIPVGPPSLSALGWPIDVEVALHNQLHARGILTRTDAMARPQEVQAAIQRALRLDVQRVQELFAGQTGD